MEIIQSPTVPRLQQNLWLDSTNNTLNAPTKDGWKSITSGAGGGGGMTKVTHDELVSLRDEGKLTPGALYRITDYVATTTQEGTKSANHPFDIVVVALDEKTLSEDAGAVAHSEEDLAKYKSVTWTLNGEHTAPFLMETNITMQGVTHLCAVFARDEHTWVLYTPENTGSIITNLSTEDVEKTEDGYVVIGQPELEFAENYTIESGYFAYSNLPAWQLKYCLDNDTDRFAWADQGVPAVPPTEGVPFAIRIQYINSNRDIFVRNTDFDDYYDGQQYYGWSHLNGQVGYLPFDDPRINYSDIYTSDQIVTTVEHPTDEDTIFYASWTVGPQEEKYHDLNYKLIETTDGKPAIPEGKGVIYWMKDEHDNEAPFDFKGITFSLQSVASSGDLQDFVNSNTPLNIDASDYQVYWLTVLPKSSDDVIEDMSTGAYCCYGNVNKKYSQGFTDLMLPSMTLSLPKNIMICYDYGGNGGPVLCIDNSFGENCGGNIVTPTPIGIKLLGANAGNDVFAVNSYGMYATIYPVLSNENITIDKDNMHVGRNSNGDMQIWNPADIASQPSTPIDDQH